jgi:hypothetical protein
LRQFAVDLLLGSGLLSRAIAWYGNGYGGFSHAASAIDEETYIDSHANVIAGVPAGVQKRAISTEKCIKRERLAKQCSQLEYDEWVHALEENIGDPYGTIYIWGFITGRHENGNGSWICSGDALRALRRLGAVPALSVPDNQITPNSLGLILEAVGFRRYVMSPIT